MKISEVITKLAAVKPHQYDDDVLIGWLSDLDRKIYDGIIAGHVGAPDTAPEVYTSADTSLLVPSPYAELYVYYLTAQVDYSNAEFARYGNSMAMFSAALNEFSAYYNCTHLPLQPNYVRC